MADLKKTVGKIKSVTADASDAKIQRMVIEVSGDCSDFKEGDPCIVTVQKATVTIAAATKDA